ncbi:MAG TPA: hypothetical protein VFV71_04535 [Burkholderiales bacterium]|nr:hypothetical protein [Burkholderiales bacterium]
MNRRDILRRAIHRIAQRAGIGQPAFHLTSVSRDDAGVFIMQTDWPQGRLICESIARVVPGFPRAPSTTCVALLPELVDEIIRVAQEGIGFGIPLYAQRL